MASTHVIQQLRIEVTASDPISARRLQDELSLWCHSETFWQRVSERLDVLVPEDTVLQIPKLEIVLEANNQSSFQKEFIESLAKQVYQISANSKGAIRKQKKDYLLQIVLFFLENGYLPASTSTQEALAMQSFLESQLTDPEFWEVFRQKLQIAPKMLSRLVQHTGLTEVRSLLHKLLKNPGEITSLTVWLENFWKEHQSVLKASGISYTEFETRLWQYILVKPAADSMQTELAFTSLLKIIFQEEINSKNVQLPKPTDIDGNQVFYIQNAGLILLSPFFPQLFNALGWLENNNWTKRSAPHKAVRLLDYVLNGKMPVGWEYNWVLPKILCGLPVETVINQEDLLEQEHFDIADKMIEAAIDQWKVLKSTSLDGLREMFLLREGKLSAYPEGTGWRLQIERKAQDILLERIPWGFSVVRLPWMEDILFVEW